MTHGDRRRSTLAHIVELLRHSHLMRYWAPVFIWVAGIFYFSSRPDPLDFLPSPRHAIGIDKLAHISEYAGLAALLHRALREQRSGSTPVRRKRRSELVLVLALAYAVFDELHQKLVPGRGFELADIGYDLAGIIAALGVTWVREK